MKRGRFITMGAIADAAGVSRSTVSKALRNDPALPVKRCVQIQRVARKLGYRPNPMVSVLMAQLRSRRRRTDPYHLAWLDFWPKGECAATAPFWRQLLTGARERAAELGYGIEVHHVGEEGLAPRRLSQILRARAQWGLILPPVPEPVKHYAFDLRGFAAVTIGTSLRDPSMHRVSTNHYQGAQLACDRLRAKGFQRIGLALSQAISERVDGKWFGGFLASQLNWPKSQRVPPLVNRSNDPDLFQRWLHRTRPDALILAEPHVLGWLPPVPTRRPQVAWLTVEHSARGVWGIDHRPTLTAAVAVDLVVGQIHRNERGVPAAPQTVLLDGAWVET